jgi:hypothetical protein
MRDRLLVHGANRVSMGLDNDCELRHVRARPCLFPQDDKKRIAVYLESWFYNQASATVRTNGDRHDQGNPH